MDHLTTFTNSIFRHCSPDGWVKHYVFEHGGKDTKPRRSDWGRLSDVAKMHDFIEWSRQRPGTVYCPPVGTFTDISRSTIEANVSEAPALVVELDDNPTEMRGIAEAVLGPATLVVRSGGVTPDGEDKLHLYWRLTRPARTPEERAVLKAARHALGALCEADMTAVPLMHPMRWPGSWHTKGTPRLCEIIAETENELDLHAAYAILNEVAPTPIRPARSEPKDGYKTAVALSGEEASRLLSKIPNSGLTWDDWNRLGMTVWDATHASEEGREAWHEWSALDARYDRDVTDSRWDHYYNSPPQDLSAASLYHKAGEVTPRPKGEEMFPEDEDTPLAVITEPPMVSRAREAGFTPHNGGMLLPDDQIRYFEGCVYISALDKVMTPNAELFGQSQFDNTYGGQAFVITSDGQGAPSKSAWEAFLRNQRFKPPRVNDLCFRPELPSLSVVEDGSWRLLNSYIPIETPRTKGDPSKFLDWLERLLPVERDRRILLSYCASIIQNPGLKAQWWPVLIGTMGNGKTLILSAIEFCIGSQYVHLPNSSKMTRSGINFNGWMRGKLFLGLEEIYSAQRRDFLEEFKPYVTNRRLPIEGKGIEEYTGDNRANGIMLTNHIDGVPINPNERRYAPFITAQESEEDCYRDGLTPAYFSDIWDWLEGRNEYAHRGQQYGYRVVNDYLQSYVPEPEFDPAQGATRRPKTSCFDRAVEAGRGGVEQEIMAAIDEERVGFAGGWVSSKFLDDLIATSRVKVPRNKRKDLMGTLGYVWHPGLELGKATSILQPDGIRSRLYVRVGTPQAALKEPGAICRAYSQAQIETKLGA